VASSEIKEIGDKDIIKLCVGQIIKVLKEGAVYLAT
jgi:hypothetical protein